MSMNADNIFFDVSALKRCGKNVIIGKTVRIRYPELVEIGDNVIIDDFTYISTALVLASYVHIAPGCKIIGGRTARVELGSFSTLTQNVVMAAGSDDYIGGIATPLVPREFKGKMDIGTITLGEHCIVGANSTVLPNVRFADGACLGSLSLANKDLEEWCLYAGIPARNLKRRDKAGIKDLEAKFKRTLNGA
jgi:acetyltransferase-like isoleucine patch superfamily enzyme